MNDLSGFDWTAGPARLRWSQMTTEQQRFPSLTQDSYTTVNNMRGAFNDAMANHQLALAKGAGSIAARSDPMQAGSIFAREYPGLMDMYNATQQQQYQRAAPGYARGVTNNYYVAGPQQQQQQMGTAGSGDLIAPDGQQSYQRGY